MKKKNYILLLIRISFLFLSIALILKFVDFKTVFLYIRNIPLFILGIMVGIGIIRAWLTGLRWQLLNPDLTDQLNKWHYFRFVMIAHTFNLVMPGALGGDFVKAALTLQTVKEKKIDNIIAIFVDRFTGLFSIIFLGTVAFLLINNMPDKNVFLILFGILYGSIFLLVFLLTYSPFHRYLYSFFLHLGNKGIWFNNLVQTWQRILRYFLMNKKKVLYAFLICIPIHVVSFITTYVLALSLSLDISFIDLSLITALVWVITAVPITISGAGVREFSMIYFLSFYGISAESATALSVYTYIVTVFLGLVGLLMLCGEFLSKYFCGLRGV